MSNPAWIVLLEFLDCAMRNARGLPEQGEDKALWTGIEFRMSGLKMVVPINEIDEVMHVPKCTQIPGAQTYVNGLANVRGRLVPVLDLNKFFQGHSKSSAKERRAFIIETDDFITGLVVDEVVGMRHFDEETYLPEVPLECKDFVPYLRGMFVDENGDEWSIFSPRYLARDDRFKQVSI